MTPSSTSDTLPDGAHVGRTALCVTDLEELTEFYREVVGLEVLTRGRTTATLGSGGESLLVLEADEDALARPRTGTGLYHNAFRVPSRRALGDALTRVRDRWQLEGSADHDVSEALYLTDPEGNGIEVYRDRPREEWSFTADGTVRMGTDPLDLGSLQADAAGKPRVPPGTDVGHVHLEVSSLEAFEEFYVDTLEFEVRATVPGARFVAAGGYHHHVGANTWHHRTTAVGERGLAWFEVVLPAATHLESLRVRLSERGIPVTETDDGVAVSDPDGIEIRFRTTA